jgi:hypothetical protein
LGVWIASFDVNFLKEFLKLFVEMHFRISFEGIQLYLFLDIGIKSYGEIKIMEEVWARRASAVANHHELAGCAQKDRHEEEGEICNGKKKALVYGASLLLVTTGPPTSSWGLVGSGLPTGGRWSSTHRQSLVDRLGSSSG